MLEVRDLNNPQLSRRVGGRRSSKPREERLGSNAKGQLRLASGAE